MNPVMDGAVMPKAGTDCCFVVKNSKKIILETRENSFPLSSTSPLLSK